MLRERISDDIYVFTSEMYAQVTAGAVVTPAGAVVIDTLAVASETREMREFLTRRLNTTVRYVINTHYHADHTYGTFLFPGAQVVSSGLCRQLLQERGIPALRQAQAQTPDLAEVQVVLPDLVFEQGGLTLHLGNKTISLALSPGHSPDGITALVREDRILFAGDTVMPTPHIVDGNWEDLTRSLYAIRELSLENVVQGHGEVILRGEIQDTIENGIAYLQCIYNRVRAVVDRKESKDALRSITMESCGASRIPLGGLVQRLHAGNLGSLYNSLR